MAILKDKLKSQIQSQFPEHIQARHPQLVEFTKEYYQFMESAQITLTSITDQDQILLETTSLNERKNKLEEILSTYVVDNFNNKTIQ